MSDRVSGQCHCGQVRVSAPPPDQITECNCTLCTKLGSLWFYHPQDLVTVEGETVAYVRADMAEPCLATHHCPRCGCTTHWTMLDGAPDARMGISARLLEDGAIEGLERRHCDGRSWPL